MSTYLGKSAEHVNAAMKQLIPETSGCSYADFPMNHGGKWKEGKDKTAKGEPCFIKTENHLPPEGAKTGYIWGPGPYGFGYYHLTTKPAYVNIYSRIVNNKVNIGPDEGCCTCFSPRDPATKLPVVKGGDKDDLKLLFHARSVARKPSDAQALKDQEAQSRMTAQAHHHFDQNIQTGTFIAQTMTRF